MTILKNVDCTKIVLSRQLDSRTKILDFCYSCCFFVFAFFFFLSIFSLESGNTLGVLVLSLLSLIFLIISFRFGNNASRSEKIMISSSQLVLIKEGFFNRKKKVYEISKIRNFRYYDLNHLPKIETALSTKNFDYLGFDTEQKLIQGLSEDNSIVFDYEGTIVSFGRNITYWEYENLSKVLIEFDIDRDYFQKPSDLIKE